VNFTHLHNIFNELAAEKSQSYVGRWMCWAHREGRGNRREERGTGEEIDRIKLSSS